MYNPHSTCIATSMLFYWLPLLCSSKLSCISSPSLRLTAFLSYLFLSSILRVTPASATYLACLKKKSIPINDLSDPLIVLIQIPSCSSPWPWCLENTWQYMLSGWLMQLHHYLTLHIGLLYFVLDLDSKAICPCVHSNELNFFWATLM